MSAVAELAIVQKAGGALQRILGDQTELVRFASGDVDEDAQFAIAKMVAENPNLNTESGVGGLIWLTTFHSEDLDQWLVGITTEYPSDDVYLTIEYMYDIGTRSKDDTADERSDGRRAVEALTELLQLYKDVDGASAITSIEALDNLVIKLGGLFAALQVDNRFLLEDLLQSYKENPEEE